MPFSEHLDCELYLTDGEARLTVADREYFGQPLLDQALLHRLTKTSRLDSTRYGSMLFEALLSNGGGTLLSGYHLALAIARHEKKRLRFRLNISLSASPVLQQLHWELLFDTGENLALSRSRETAFSRYLSIPLAPMTTVVGKPNILVVISSPKNQSDYHLPELDREQIRRSLVRVLDPLDDILSYEVLDGPATPGNIRQCLVAGNFHALHIQAHGMFHSERPTAVLILEGADREARFVDEALLAEIFDGEQTLRLVTLAACHGGIQACSNPFSGLGPRLVQRGIPAVLTMRHQISIQAAACFVEHFYINLAESGRIDLATNEARLQLYLAEPEAPDWATPALFMRLKEGLLWTRDRSDLRDHQISAPNTRPGGHFFHREGISEHAADIRSSTNPFNQTLAIREPAFFIGRQAELRRLSDLLQGGSVALFGEAKIGKSSLLWQLAVCWDGQVLGPLDLQEIEDREDFYATLAEALQLGSSTWRDLRSNLRSRRLLLLLDELDVGPARGFTAEDLGRFRAICGQNSSFRIAAVSHSQLKSVFPDSGCGSPPYNFLQPITLGKMAPAEAQRLLSHPWAPEASNFDQPTIDHLLMVADRHPFKLQRAAFHRYETLANDAIYDWQVEWQRDLELML